jgi:hypothetical protein
MVVGDWVDVQVLLGLLSAEEAEQQRPKALPETPFPSKTREMIPTPVPGRERRQRVAVHKKAKGKMAKQSRKKNRKR